MIRFVYDMLSVNSSKIYILIIISTAIYGTAFAQDTAYNKPDTYRKSKITWQNLKIYFDDDFLNFAGKGTDQYYTGGWQVDAYYTRNIPRKPIPDKLFLELPGSDNLYYYGIFRRIYTPSDISKPEIIYGDRPYASVLTVQHGLISSNPELKESLSTDIGIGAIGPMTYGSELQTWFHRSVGAQKPMGWGHQIKNDIILDYRVNYEKQVIAPSENLEILTNIDCEAGTLADNIGVGATLVFGRFNNSFIKDNIQMLRRSDHQHKTIFYFYMHPTVRAVMYNATLEGGFFSQTSPYTINRNDIKYVYLQYDYGLVVFVRKVGFSYTQKLRTAEFINSGIQLVGNITMFIPL